MSTRIQKLRKGIVEEEQIGSEIVLGEEFQNEHCLTVSEVYHYLADKKKTVNGSSKGAASVVNTNAAQELNKLFLYCEKFTQFSSPAMVVEVRKLIEEFPGLDLHEVEIAQIGNFLCETSEEIKSLVPSLTRVDDNLLQELLDRISNLRKFGA